MKTATVAGLDGFHRHHLSCRHLFLNDRDAYAQFQEHGSAPDTPMANYVRVYAKGDGRMYMKDDTGNEVLMASGLSESHVSLFSSASDVSFDSTGLT